MKFERSLAEWSIILVHFFSQFELALIVILSKSGPIKPKGKSTRFFSIEFLSSILFKINKIEIMKFID